MIKYGRNLVMFMKKIELLAPAGNMEMLKAAIQAGCDAVYLGGKSFGARAFSQNFTNEELVEAINYAHLYGVKVYVTVNTLIYENEVDSFLKYIEFIHQNNVDAVLIQDLGMFDLVRKTFPNLELHASTQMHIHNLDGVKLMEKLGMKRVVLARETSIDEIKRIKDNTDIEIEVFVHGALCISYSGQCLMSSLIGGRSGNRGACVGSCRLKYDVMTENGEIINNDSYPLSTKDLNSLEYIGDLIDAGIISLKIEGRMKSKEYVYKVVSLYRRAIDNYYDEGKIVINEKDMLELKKIFNRDYTKGFLNNAINEEIINGYRPNHMGVEVGKVIGYNNGIVKIKLSDKVTIGSGLRVICKNGDVGISVNNFYIDKQLVKEGNAGDVISIKINDSVSIGDKVVITSDSKLNKEIDNLIDDNLRKVMIKGKFVAKLNDTIKLILNDGVNTIKVSGNVVNKAINNPTDKETIKEKLNKLGDTVYKFSSLEVNIDDNIFIPLKEINDLRRKGIDLLNEKRIYKYEIKKGKYEIDLPDFKKEKLLTCLVSDKETFDKLDRKYDVIYAEERIDGTILKLPRVISDYPDYNNEVMIGEIGGLNKYKSVDTDFSLNVTNSYTVAFLHSLGAKRITLSYELDDKMIKEIIDNYHKRYGKHPNVEVIIAGYPEVMISKYSLNRHYNNDKLYLRDRFGNKFKIRTKDDLMYIYHYKKLDNYNDRDDDIGVNALRINLDI